MKIQLRTHYIGTFYTFDCNGKRVGNASAGGNSRSRRKMKRKLLRTGLRIEIATSMLEA